VSLYYSDHSGKVYLRKLDCNTPAYYSGGPGFRSQPGARLVTEVYRGFLVPLGECRDRTEKKIDHDLFLLYPFQLIVHLSPFHSTLCSLSY
jgi:hypothetical protein